jgi:serine/threonine protein kinase
MKTPKPKDDQMKPQRQGMQMPDWAYSFSALGGNTRDVIQRYFRERKSQDLFDISDDEAMKSIADALGHGWDDSEAAKVVTEFATLINSGRHIETSSLRRWILSHQNDAAAVIDCMSVEAPNEISIIKVLSRAGSQKLVFLATWHLMQRQVVVKRLTGPPEIARLIMERESHSHPLAMAHPNIIQTHFLENDKGERFLVERCLPVLLSDSWESHGIQEAANLLYDIANALEYLHSNELVHGDIKPDNIGREGENYILLDFGICRSSKEFTADVTGTGSLRTRAPELLEDNAYIDPPKSDVWALGATVYNALNGRFPLFGAGEKPPRASHQSERSTFEVELVRRAREEWAHRVDLKRIPAPIQGVLAHALERDPSARFSATQLKQHAARELSMFLRDPLKEKKEKRFSPLDELHQLTAYLPSQDVLQMMPQIQKEKLKGKLLSLKNNYQFNTEQVSAIDKLLKGV